MEAVTNKTWEILLEEKVWGPLGMVGCGFGVAPESQRGAIEQSWPHKVSNDADVDYVDPFSRYADLPKAYGPAGLAHCALESWSKFLNMHMHMRGRNGKNVPIDLSQEAFTKLNTPRLANYTYGAWITSSQAWPGKNHHLVLSHTGCNLRNFALALLDVDDERAYFSVTNAGAEDRIRPDRAGRLAVEAAIDGLLFPQTVTGADASSMQSHESLGFFDSVPKHGQAILKDMDQL